MMKLAITCTLLIFCQCAHAASLLYSENFDDQDIDQPSVGSIQVVRSIGPMITCTEGIDYTVSAQGRNGSNGSFLSLQTEANLDAESWIWWPYSETWPANQMYVSFWLRYPHFVSTDAHENLKLFYPHWDGTSSYVAYDLSSDDSMYHSEKSNDEYVSTGNWLTVPNQTDGNWHHYEFFLDFEMGISRFIYDDSIIWDKNWGPGTWTVPVPMYYLTFCMIDAEEPGNFTRQIDDIEVWDGMPDVGDVPISDNDAPTAPANLRIIQP
ncbi:MAG: hypothetical protein A2219_05505 [Elusimicrobia bacterium RIFOXYA2_FULL_50_26]|nr:MAG: hypothetical protein A2219_05505 [Elusimicrobia bacterium RIFOXYA2_FULL_50_26]OGS24404.1 MAG: hypothetical protein A2314_04210 [Elusimicrobia bacterium RIFOXYB2_FULL_50_12]